MKSLTKLWGNFNSILLNKNALVVTNRIFLQKLEDPEHKDSSLYVGINTLSGSIDIFTEKEGIYLERLIKKNIDISDVPEKFILQLKNRGYVFPSLQVENLIFNTIINRFKNLKYSTDKIFPLFAIDTSCPMQCEYCFEKKYLGQSNVFEKSIMDKESLIAAFQTLDMIQTLQQKEIELVGGWGGEPLQEKHSNINELFISYTNERGWSIGYFSNLALIGENLLAVLEKNASKIKFIQTTLDATFSQHNQYRTLPNAFEKTVANINKLLDIGIPIRVRTNLGPHNINELPALASFYRDQKWFDFPNFQTFITKTFDRYHDQKKQFTFTEDQALTHWLQLKDEYPQVRKMQTYKFVPSLYNILRAFELREAMDIIHGNFEVPIKPMLTYCYAGNKSMYVFTGRPEWSIYNCAECVGLSKFKIGQYYPSLAFDSEKMKMWDLEDNKFYAIRSIDTLEKCKTCTAATFCGGYCALEAITDNGSSNQVYCKDAPTIISNFLKNESARLYKRSRVLLDSSINLTL